MERIAFQACVRRCAFATLVLVAAALVSGCGTSSTVSTTGPSAVKCVVSLTAPPMMEADGGTGSLAIATQPECAWDASTNVNWISGLSPASGQGTAEVSFRVAANEGSSPREGMIAVNGEQARISQRAPCRFDLAPPSQSIGASGGESSITIDTSAECRWTVIAEVSWIGLMSASAGSGPGRVGFVVAPNQGNQRTGSIALGNQRSFVTQAGISAPPPPSCSPTISPTGQSVGALGGEGTPVAVSAASTCQWTATSNAPWIMVTSGTTGAGNGSVTFTVAANSGAARTGTLTIATRTFTVTQAASGTPPPPPPTPPPVCSYSISPTSVSVPVRGDSGSVGVSTSTGCAWTAVSNASWITMTAGSSGTGDGTVGYLVLPNTSGARTGTLTIAGHAFTVTQAAIVCSYSISPTSQRVGRGAGSSTISVTTSSSCAWTATSHSPWITVTSGASGTGNGTVTFSYTRNNTGNDRTGSLTVAGQTATVEQNGASGGNDDD